MHLTSFHSWLGLATTFLLVQNDTLGSIIFFVPSIAMKYAHIYRPLHKFLGISAYIFAMITIFTGTISTALFHFVNSLTSFIDEGIMEKQTFQECNTTRTDTKQEDPATFYDHIPGS